MRLGFAVKVLGDGGLPSHDARKWQSGPHLRWSLEALHGVLDYLERTDIGMYRMTASLAPYATHPDMPQFHHQIEEARSELAELGARLAAGDVRLSSHSGPVHRPELRGPGDPRRRGARPEPPGRALRRHGPRARGDRRPARRRRHGRPRGVHGPLRVRPREPHGRRARPP